MKTTKTPVAMLEGIQPKSLMYGIVTTLVLILFLSMISAIIVYYSNIPESSLNVFATVINIISLAAGGYVGSKTARSRGLIHGLIIGLVVVIILIIAGNNGGSNLPVTAAYSILAAIIGGVLGVK